MFFVILDYVDVNDMVMELFNELKCIVIGVGSEEYKDII